MPRHAPDPPALLNKALERACWSCIATDIVKEKVLKELGYFCLVKRSIPK